MLNNILPLFIFFIILFIYVHINHQLKTSNNLEIYELDNLYKDNLEELCNYKQPIIFNLDFSNSELLKLLNKHSIISNYSSFLINICSTDKIHLPIQLKEAETIFSKDTTKSYYTENNDDFLDETGLLQVFKYNDSLFKPYFLCRSKYDFITGSKDSYTPFRYSLSYRNYFIVTQGSVRIKLTPPKNIKYLNIHRDYNTFDFKSKIDIWNPQKEFINDVEKIKCLELMLGVGKCIFIPPYWSYSILFEEHTSSVISLQYNTYMNNVAILPELIIYILQQLNTVAKFVKPSEKYISSPELLKSNIPDTQEQKTTSISTTETSLTKDTLQNNKPFDIQSQILVSSTPQQFSTQTTELKNPLPQNTLPSSITKTHDELIKSMLITLD